MAVSRQQLLDQPRSGARPLNVARGAEPARPQTEARTTAKQAPAAVPGAQATPAAGTSRQPPAPAAAPSAAALRPGRVSTVTSQGGGLVLALVLYPLGLNLLKGGPARMWAWVKAKWVNQPLGAAPSLAGVPGPAVMSLPPNAAQRAAAAQGRPNPGSVQSRY